MPSPDRKERSRSPDDLTHQLGAIPRHLITQVETQTGRPVVLRPGEPDIHGTYAHISYAAGAEPHTIFVIPEATQYLDYLVAHECGHALRIFAVPERNRLLAYADEHHRERALRALVPAIMKRWNDRLGERAELVAGIYHQGVVSQLANFPADMRIEAWLFREYPELRPMQDAGLRANIGELVFGLHPDVKAATPAFVFRIQNALNAGYCTFMSRLLGNLGLSRPFAQAGYGGVGHELAGQVWQHRFADYAQDIRDSQDWAKRFAVGRWFTWRHYRDNIG